MTWITQPLDINTEDRAPKNMEDKGHQGKHGTTEAWIDISLGNLQQHFQMTIFLMELRCPMKD